jgi:Leucine-rich repeat (LRR) protein
VLHCDNNQLTSLPKLPDGLKELDCSYNQLPSLPELPDGLEELDCSNNPFRKEAIEKIKSHPNYDPKNWRF